MPYQLICEYTVVILRGLGTFLWIWDGTHRPSIYSKTAKSALLYVIFCYKNGNDVIALHKSKKQWTCLHDQRINKNIATSI